MSKNCGINALEKIAELKQVSALSLIHLARDNGIDLWIYKIKDKDTMNVQRPAIFHSENHFEYIENGEPLPKQKWTGYVLTTRSIGIPISHAEAKLVKGAGPVLIPVLIGAAVSTAVKVTTNVITKKPAFEGVGGAVGIGALTGGIGGIAGSLAQGGAAAIQVGKAASLLQKVGTVAAAHPYITGAAVGAGAGAAGLAGDGGIKGAIEGGLTGVGTAAGIKGVGKFSEAYKTATAAGKNIGAASLAGFGAATGLGGGTAGATGTLPAGATIGKATVGATKAPFVQGLSGAATFSPAEHAAYLASGRTGASIGAIKGLSATTQQAIDTSAKSAGFFNTTAGKLAGAAGTAIVGKTLGPKAPAALQYDPTKQYSVLKDILGEQALPASTKEQLEKDITTPLSQLSTQFTPQKDQIFRRVNQSFDRAEQNLRRVYASAGQNERTSSDLRNELQKSQQDRATALAEAEQELVNEGLRRGIEAKQFALARSIEGNQFNIGLALELADAIGQKEAFEAALQQDDVNKFNEILANIMQIGFGDGGIS